MSHVGFSVVCVSVCVGHTDFLCKNLYRCRLGGWRMRFQGTMGSWTDEYIRSRMGWQIGDVAFCQITLDTCYCCNCIQQRNNSNNVQNETRIASFRRNCMFHVSHWLSCHHWVIYSTFFNWISLAITHTLTNLYIFYRATLC